MLRSALANTLASARRAAPRLRAALCDALAAVPREEAAASARKVAELQAQLRGRDEELGQRLRGAELGAAQDVAQRDGTIAELRARLRTSVRDFATLATAAQALCEALAAEDRIEGAVLRAYNVLRAALGGAPMTLEIQLEGPHRPRPHRQRSAWPLVLAVLALFAAGLVARKAAPSSGKGHRCADNADCPSMVCSAGRCQ